MSGRQLVAMEVVTAVGAVGGVMGMGRRVGKVGGGLRLYRRRWRTLRLGLCRGLIAAGGEPKAGEKGKVKVTA